jgi:ADP-heptose:LPS heptosyltransferase
LLFKRKIKILLSVIFIFIDAMSIKRKNNSSNKKGLLLIRLDAIGDYILFRNFIKILKESEEFQGQKITLVGNLIWRNLAQTLDKKYINEFIWVDRKKFSKNLIYRFRKLKEISSKSYKTAICPTFSREFLFGDTIIKKISAEEKIGSKGDLSNISKWEKKISDSYYTRLISTGDEILFEYYRNKEFFQNLLGSKIKEEKPIINLEDINVELELPEKFIVFFPGAGRESRKWNEKKFFKVAEGLLKKYSIKIIICGSKGEKGFAENLGIKTGNNILDFTGKTTLTELAFIISKSKILISNETCAPHFAVAVGTPVFVLSNGNHFGRFTPYPEEMTKNYFPIFHPKIMEGLQNIELLKSNYGNGSLLDINVIRPEEVIKEIEKKFSKVLKNSALN